MKTPCAKGQALRNIARIALQISDTLSSPHGIVFNVVLCYMHSRHCDGCLNVERSQQADGPELGLA